MRPQYDAFKILRVIYLNRDKGKMSSKEISEKTGIPRTQIAGATRRMLGVGYIQKTKVGRTPYYSIPKWQLGEKGVKRILEKGMEELENEKRMGGN